MVHDRVGSSDELRIRHLAVNYLVSSEHPAPHRVASALDALCARQLPAALNRQVVEPMQSVEADDGIWLIKKLVAEIDLDLGLDEDAQTQRWAGQIARQLARTLNDPDSNVLFFPSRSAWRGRLILDLARGDAWDHWYHRHFEGIKALPASAAIRTVLTDDAADPALVFAALSASERTEVISSLGEAEARRVLDHWLTDSGSDDESTPAASDVDRLLNNTAKVPPKLDSVPVLKSLWLLASTAELFSNCFPRLLVVLAEGLVLIDRMSADDTVTVLDALKRGDVVNLCHRVPERADLWQSLVAVPQELTRQLCTRCSPISADPHRGIEVKDTAISRQTSFGGWFYLLPQLEATLPWNELADWPELQGTPASKLLRWLVLAHCGGSRFFGPAIKDGFWRDSFGIDPAISLVSVEEWINGIAPERWLRLRQLVIRHELNLSEDPMVLGVNRGDDRLAILADEATGHWIDVLPLNGATLSQAVKLLYLDSLATGVASNNQTIKLHGFDDAADTEADWLDISEKMDLSGDASLLLMLATQRVLRKFARRIPGFSRASFQHLHTNVLDVDASIDVEDDRTLVRVSRPPLDVMLNMTGINRSRPVLPWWDGPPLEIYPNDQ